MQFADFGTIVYIILGIIWVLAKVIGGDKKKKKKTPRPSPSPKRQNKQPESNPFEDILREFGVDIPDEPQVETVEPQFSDFDGEIPQSSKSQRVDYSRFEGQLDQEMPKKSHRRRIELNNDFDEPKEEKVQFDFDLRQAVISQVILDRPYK